MVTEGHCGHCGHSRGVFSSRLVMSCARGRAAARVWQDWHATSGSPAVSPEPLSASHASASGVPPCEAHGWTWVAGWRWAGDMGAWVRRRHQVPAACHLKWAPARSFTVQQQRPPPQRAQTSDMPCPLN